MSLSAPWFVSFHTNRVLRMYRCFSQGRVDTPNPGNTEFNIKGPQTTIFNQYLSMFQFSDTPEVTGPSMPAASMPTVGMRSVNVPSAAPSVGIPGLPKTAGTNLTTYNITMQPFGVTRLEAPATPGATKLVCQTPPDCKRGMYVVVGSGSTAEVGTIAGFGRCCWPGHSMPGIVVRLS